MRFTDSERLSLVIRRRPEAGEGSRFMATRYGVGSVQIPRRSGALQVGMQELGTPVISGAQWSSVAALAARDCAPEPASRCRARRCTRD